MSRIVINPNLRGIRRIFTDEELEIADRFNIKQELEKFYRSRAEYFHLPLPVIRRIGSDTNALTQTLAQVYGFPRELAKSYASFQKKMIWKETPARSGSMDFMNLYREWIRNRYKLPDEVVTRFLDNELTIDQAIVEVHAISSSTAYNVMKNRISIDDALLGKDIQVLTPFGLLQGLFHTVRYHR